MKFSEMHVCLDMAGCPNRCKHCWLGEAPNGHMAVDELEWAAKQFRPFTDCLEIFDWYREPDFRKDYKELWELCGRLSDKHTEHFELVSVWRLVRDEAYVQWLSSLGLKTAQLTVFGDEETTDYYTGRKGAYRDILKAIDILLENQISIRLQTFLNRDNIAQLPHVEKLIRTLELEKRCASFGGRFAFFLHQGSCDGENEKLYDVRVTPDDIPNIPPLLAAYTLQHFHKSHLGEVFGKTEQSLYEELREDRSTASYSSARPVFYIDKDFYVYPNITTPAPHWCLGNLKTGGVRAVLENYAENRSPAQHARLTVPLGDMVQSQGDGNSRRLFTKDDYIVYILNRYCRQLPMPESRACRSCPE